MIDLQEAWACVWGWKDDDDLTSLCVDGVRPRRNIFL